MNITSLGGKSLFCANMIKDLELRRKIWIIWVRVNVITARKTQRENTHTHTHTHTHTRASSVKMQPSELILSGGCTLWVPEGPPSSWNPCPLYYSSFISSTSVPFHELAVFLPIQNPQKFWSPLVYILWILWESTPLATRTLRRFFLGKRISIPAFC